MRSRTIVANYDDTPMSFDADGWFNATLAAEKFGKRIDHWLANQETKDYLRALAEADSNTRHSGYLRAKRGRNGGTWMHPDLAVAFARWLDVRFAIWCDRQIKALISGTHPHHDWLRARHEAASSHKVMCAMLKLVRDEGGQVTAGYHFSNEARLVNWALTGAFQGLDRDALTPHELDVLARLEEQNAVMIGRGVDYRFRKPALETLARVLLSTRVEAA